MALEVLLVCVLVMCFWAAGASAATTIKFWTHVHEPESVKWFVTEFERQNPDIKVQLEQTPSAQYFDKLVVALAAGTGPDVWWLPDWYFELFSGKGLLAPVDTGAFKAASYAALEQSYMPGVLAGFKGDDGKLYGGGVSEVNVWSLVYDKRHFRDAGLELPSETAPMTWSQTSEIAKKLTKRDAAGKMQRVGYHTLSNVGSATYYLEWFEPLLRGAKGRWFNEKGASALTEPAGIKAMDLWRDMVWTHKVDDPHFALSFIEDLPQGRASMQLMGPWYMPIVKAINPDCEVGVAPQPIVDGGPRITHIYAWSYLVSSRTTKAKQDAAWKFAAWMTAQNEDWWNKLGFLQPTDTWLAKFPFDKYPYMKAFLDDMRYGAYLVRTPHISELGKIVKDAVERCTMSNMTSKESLEIASQEWNKVVQK